VAVRMSVLVVMIDVVCLKDRKKMTRILPDHAHKF
jgi:hypothetical protein